MPKPGRHSLQTEETFGIHITDKLVHGLILISFVFPRHIHQPRLELGGYIPSAHVPTTTGRSVIERGAVLSWKQHKTTTDFQVKLENAVFESWKPTRKTI